MAASRKTAGRTGSSAGADKEKFPTAEEAKAAFAPAQVETLKRVRLLLQSMREYPPQLLHLEGGSDASREAVALWWAALLNCEGGGHDPCFCCSSCLRTGARMHPDLFVFDGREGSIKIDDMRALRPVMGEKPHFGRRRVIVLLEAQALSTEAANALLKVLEEPSPDTCFVFTMPQRERLLPTLISRGWVLTLPWAETGAALPASMQIWQNALAVFVSEGRGWFDRVQERNSLDALSAQNVVLAGQKALADTLAGRGQGALAAVFQKLPVESLLDASDLFEECQNALLAQVNPLLALDAMATGLYRLAHEKRR
ncbi:MAG: DNA polymerase III subunit delta [Mailhella sp.]